VEVEEELVKQTAAVVEVVLERDVYPLLNTLLVL